MTIFHASALAILDEFDGFRAEAFDLLLTDPPYGIGADKGQQGRANRQDGKALAPSREYLKSDWDIRPAQEAIALARRLARWHVIFGGNFYDLPPARCWLVWDKDNGTNDYADCEIAWTNLAKPIRKLSYRWHGMLTEPGCPKEYRDHPTQKPEPVMRWALMQAPQDVRTVLDPFMGSGTTLVACKRLGRACVGIERDERYCEIAATRLQQEALPLAFTEGDSEVKVAP